MPAPKSATSVESKALSAPQKALRKLGLDRDIDLALHLPLRYEDETRLGRLADTRDGDSVQVEATVVSCEIAYKPRRQLLVVVDRNPAVQQLRVILAQPAGQFDTIDARHHQIGHYQADGGGMFIENHQGLLTGIGGQDMVTGPFEDLLRDQQHRLLVVDHHDLA